MMRLVRPLIISGIVLLFSSACNGNYPLNSHSNVNGTATAAEIENSSQEPLMLPLALSQNLTPHSPTLALTVQTDNKSTSLPVNARYDDATATWRANIKTKPGDSTELILTWSETIGDQSLKLAQAAKSVSVPTDIKQLNLDIPNDKYNQSFDADADGLSNLAETTNSTNPFDSSDPGSSLVKVEVNVQLFLAGELSETKSTASVIPSNFLNGTEMTLSFNRNPKERSEPVSDADFDKALGKFGALSQAIENKDADALDRLATASKQSELFKKLMKNDYDQIEVSIKDIRLRDIDKSITGTLQIDSLVHPNGDRSSLSEKYASRKITSRRVNGAWSKIEW